MLQFSVSNRNRYRKSSYEMLWLLTDIFTVFGEPSSDEIYICSGSNSIGVFW